VLAAAENACQNKNGPLDELSGIHRISSFRQQVGGKWLEAEFIAGWIQPLSIWQSADWHQNASSRGEVCRSRQGSASFARSLTIWLLQEWHLVLNKGCARERLSFSAEDTRVCTNCSPRPLAANASGFRRVRLCQESMDPRGRMFFE